jgi:hypothetical protein
MYMNATISHKISCVLFFTFYMCMSCSEFHVEIKRAVTRRITSVEFVAHGLPRIVIVVPDDSSLEHTDGLQAALVAKTLDEIL